MAKRRILFLGLLLLATGLGGGWYILSNAGPYCRVTIVSLTINNSGQAQLVYETTHSNGASFFSRHTVNGVIQSESSATGSSFPPFPMHGRSTEALALDPERQTPLSELDRATLAARVKVAEGETYTVRPNEPLTLYRFTGASGNVYEGRIDVASNP